MSAHVLLNILNEMGKRDKMRGLPLVVFSILLHGVIPLRDATSYDKMLSRKYENKYRKIGPIHHEKHMYVLHE